jgi:hypothetical protein
MPNIQTAYNINHVVAVPGAQADQRRCDFETKLAAAQINFGTFVTKSTSPAAGVDQTANPSATGDVTARPHGIAMYDETVRNGFGYELNRPVKIMRRGLVWVVAETDVAIVDGAQAFIRFTANGAGKLVVGAFRADVDGGNAVALGNMCVFRAGFTTGTLALVEINLP